MSDETKPYDPWKATNDDLEVYLSAPLMPLTGSLQAALDRIRARVEACQAAEATVKPEPHHDKPWVKIGNWILQPDKIARVNIAEAIDGPGGGFGELKHDEIQALLAYLTDPVRCVDLTPSKNED